jgi:hypothetical protein
MAHQIHPGDPAYAPPLIRSPSPASSIGTASAPDETSPSDAELDDDEFDEEQRRRLFPDVPPEAEQRAMRSVLLPRPKDSEEQQSAPRLRLPVPARVLTGARAQGTLRR